MARNNGWDVIDRSRVDEEKGDARNEYSPTRTKETILIELTETCLE